MVVLPNNSTRGASLMKLASHPYLPLILAELVWYLIAVRIYIFKPSRSKGQDKKV